MTKKGILVFLNTTPYLMSIPSSKFLCGLVESIQCPYIIHMVYAEGGSPTSQSLPLHRHHLS